MRTIFRVALLTLAFSLWAVAESGPAALAKGPGGGGKGRGGASSYHGRGPSTKGHAPTRGQPHRASTKPTKAPGGGKGRTTELARPGGRNRLGHSSSRSAPTRPSDVQAPSPVSSIDQGAEGHHPWSMQRANEERKRTHRLNTADRLDQIAERNGNDRLHETAERMRQKADEHYEKRMAKIDGKDPLFSPPEDGPEGRPDLPTDPDEPGLPDLNDISDSSDLLDEADLTDPDRLLDSADKLTGRENALWRQLRNEERKLEHKLQLAERLLDAYDQTGDEFLEDAASRIEQRAVDHYEKRMEAIRSFQQRHGLLDLIADPVAP